MKKIFVLLLFLIFIYAYTEIFNQTHFSKYLTDSIHPRNLAFLKLS